MDRPIRVLIVEDTEADADLLVRSMEKGGYAPEWARVTTEPQFIDSLEKRSWDLILSDFNVPGFGALRALELLKATKLTTPFLVVSGAIGEETAVGLMKAGADDYIMKANLGKLVPTLDRTLREVESRRREEESRKSEERALRDRELLIAMVSHDLKNPIGALKLNHQLMIRILRDSQSPELRETLLVKLGEQLKRAQRSVERMEILIRDVLDMARIEAGKLLVTKTECRADLLISELVELFQPLAMQKSILLEIDVPDDASCLAPFDAPKIHQVLSNLLSNALKFAPPKGTVRLSLRSTPEELIFTVRDNGPGIPAEALPRIFDRFYQVENRLVEGTGLGLAIAFGIVQSHGGRIWVESQPDSGAAFYVAIPN